MGPSFARYRLVSSFARLLRHAQDKLALPAIANAIAFAGGLLKLSVYYRIVLYPVVNIERHYRIIVMLDPERNIIFPLYFQKSCAIVG